MMTDGGPMEDSVKAVVYEGPRKVSVKDVPDARIERPTDVLVRITTTNICGSDLHMYEGRTDFETGRWFGHENLGQVIEVGDGIDKVKVGEYVVLPFNVACGHCKNCERGYTNYCLTAQPKQEWAGAAYGFADMGPAARRSCWGCPGATSTVCAWGRTPRRGRPTT
jgi:glutathione-independent formaldehyde dehydrogenase